MATGTKKRNPMRWRAVLTAAAVMLVLAACAGGVQVIPTGEQIPILGSGTHPGQWQSMDAEVRYRYTVDSQSPDRIQVSGTISPRSRLAELKLTMAFLDGEGKVLESRLLYSSGYRQEQIGGTFEQTLDLPQDAEAFTFRSQSQAFRGYR